MLKNQHRVLIWNQAPVNSNSAPDLVLGQPGFSTYIGNNDTGGASARTFASPQGSWTDGKKLVISDRINSRVLIWSYISTQSYTPADIVIGQLGFSATSANEGVATPTASSLNGPKGVYSDGTRLYVADTGNHRVLIWNQFPTQSHAAADVVLGQTSFSGKTANSPVISGATLSGPLSVAVSGGKVVVGDSGNRRVLVWNSIPTSSSTSADVVLGQPDFVTSTAYTGGSANMQNWNGIGMVQAYAGKLYVSNAAASVSYGNIFVWNSIPTVNNAPADWMLPVTTPHTGGQFIGNSEYTIATDSIAFGINDDYFYIPDGFYYRILGIPNQFPIALSSFNETNSLTVKLTALTCNNNIDSFLINESDVAPSYRDSSWQNCASSLNGTSKISYTLSSSDGLHLLRAWVKTTAGYVRSQPYKIPVIYDKTPPNVPALILSSSNPTASSNITLTAADCTDATFIAVTADSNPPLSSASSWQACTTASGGITYSLTNINPGSQTLSVWAKDKAGNVSSTSKSISVTYSP